MAANGDLFIADSANHVIRKVDHATGIITTVVGEGGNNGDDGDGGPATAAHIDGPKGIIFDANWNLLIADSGNAKIRRVDAATGVITTIAGTGETGLSGDGGPATAAQLDEPRTLALAPDGSIYFTEPKANKVRRIDPSGIITTFAGTGKAGFSGDGGPATKAQLNFNRGVNVDGAGTVWIADSLNQRIRKVDAAGIITTAAGNGKACYYSSNNNCGDGGPATQAGFAIPRALEFDDAGNLYVATPSTSGSAASTASPAPSATHRPRPHLRLAQPGGIRWTGSRPGGWRGCGPVRQRGDRELHRFAGRHHGLLPVVEEGERLALLQLVDDLARAWPSRRGCGAGTRD